MENKKISIEVSQAEFELLDRIRQMNCGKIEAFIGNGYLLKIIIETSLKFKNKADSKLRS